MKRCRPNNQDQVYRWLHRYYGELVELMLLHHTKDECARRLRDDLHNAGIKRTDTGVFLSRNQIRQGLVPFRRLPTAQREAKLAEGVSTGSSSC